jgi:hypothetical protein
MKLDSPKWDALFVVCKDCRKRKNGPGDVRAKSLVGIIRMGTRDSRPRPRAIVSSCLGLCPKRATAVAFAGPDVAPQVISVESESELEKNLALLSNGRYP